jgi:hypothetical protein
VSSGAIDFKKGGKTVKLDLGILVGADSKAWLQQVTKQLDRMEELLAQLKGVGVASTTPKTTAKTKKAKEPEEIEETESEETEEDEDDFAPKAKKKKAQAQVDFDEDEEKEADEEEETDEVEAAAESEEDDEGGEVETGEAGETAEVGDEAEEETESFDEPEEPKKRGRPKKKTKDDVNQACMAYAKAKGGGKVGRDKVLAILKKKFETDRISDIDPAKYEDVIKAFKL